MAASAEEEEVLAEVEAVQAVYGEDCRVICPFPPHIDVCLRPRTADDYSQQFVEAVLGIRAGAQYPHQPPCIILVESKGLDEKRQEHLTAVLNSKAQELSSCLMLVALCEEAVEILSNMNHPEGSCPLCLYPLFEGDAKALPFMKLMSCFHCFHSKCILRWWKWLRQQTENDVNKQSMSSTHVSASQHLQNCPVCRMVFHANDIKHVLHLLRTCTDKESLEATASEDGEMEALQSDVENTRRQKFEALLNQQRENSGLIEPKKDLVVVPGMFLPERMIQTAVSSGGSAECTENRDADEMVAANPNNDASAKPTLNVQNQRNVRRAARGRAHNSRKHPNAPSSRREWCAQPSRKQWIKKGDDMDY